MKKYFKPEIEIIDVQLSEYCDQILISSTDTDSTDPEETGGYGGNSIQGADSLDD